jgi:putative phosphoesterase
VKRTTGDLLRQGILSGADIIVFGHTHLPLNAEEDGVLLFNPGSATYPRGSVPTFGLITVLGKNNIQAEIIELS